ncbi:unnamed protein product [Malus baccata var. baccata]
MHAKPISVEVFFTDWKGLVDAQCYCQFHQDKCRSFPQIVYVSLFAYCTGGGSSQSFQGTENRPVFCWESCSGKDRGDSNLSGRSGGVSIKRFVACSTARSLIPRALSFARSLLLMTSRASSPPLPTSLGGLGGLGVAPTRDVLPIFSVVWLIYSRRSSCFSLSRLFWAWRRFLTSFTSPTPASMFFIFSSIPESLALSSRRPLRRVVSGLPEKTPSLILLLVIPRG